MSKTRKKGLRRKGWLLLFCLGAFNLIIIFLVRSENQSRMSWENRGIWGELRDTLKVLNFGYWWARYVEPLWSSDGFDYWDYDSSEDPWFALLAIFVCLIAWSGLIGPRKKSVPNEASVGPLTNRDSFDGDTKKWAQQTTHSRIPEPRQVSNPSGQSARTPTQPAPRASSATPTSTATTPKNSSKTSNTTKASASKSPSKPSPEATQFPYEFKIDIRVAGVVWPLGLGWHGIGAVTCSVRQIGVSNHRTLREGIFIGVSTFGSKNDSLVCLGTTKMEMDPLGRARTVANEILEKAESDFKVEPNSDFKTRLIRETFSMTVRDPGALQHPMKELPEFRNVGHLFETLSFDPHSLGRIIANPNLWREGHGIS